MTPSTLAIKTKFMYFYIIGFYDFRKGARGLRSPFFLSINSTTMAKNLKEAILASAGLMNTIAEIAKDGKFSFFTEVWSLAPHVTSLGKVAANVKEIKKEVEAGITAQQEQEIIEAVKAKLDFPNDTAEAIAERVIKWVLVTVLTVDFIIDAVKAKK